MKLEQRLFDKVVNHIRIQGLDKPGLYCPVAKTMCAVGYLYADAFGKKRLRNLVEEALINDFIGFTTTRQVVKELKDKYTDVSITFFQDLILAHDMSIEHQLSFEIAAEQFALKYHLDYTKPKVSADVLNLEKEIPEDYDTDLPIAA
jgi:hypothetical protein